MSTLAREFVLLAIAATVTWCLFLRPTVQTMPSAPAPMEHPLRVALAASSPPVPDPAPAAEPEPQAAAEPTPPPPELGAPEGEGDVAALPPAAESAEADAEADQDAPDEETGASSGEVLMEDAELLEVARAELSEDARHGFATVLLASPEEQIEVARFFGEELVLVPKRALNPADPRPRWYRLDLAGIPQVETVASRPPLESFRQYRDLFEYEYARLPAPLRELRRSVLTRDDVYVFAALVPQREWALVIGRRREALEQSGREEGDVRRFVLRYVRLPEGGFDVRVEEIVFVDGERHRPRPLQGV